MITKQEDKEIFQSELIAEKTIGNLILRIYSNRIFHVTILPFQKIDMGLIQIGNKFIQENGGGRFHNIFQFDSFSHVDPEVRKWAADKEGNKFTLSDAIVIKSLSQKLIADIYVRFEKPIKPTKVFYKLQEAIEWSKQQMIH